MGKNQIILHNLCVEKTNLRFEILAKRYGLLFASGCYRVLKDFISLDSLNIYISRIKPNQNFVRRQLLGGHILWERGRKLVKCLNPIIFIA